ncbi:E3 ubiquitin-protein ligase TRIM45-like [Mytilus edulis]|uniref:E3 ubiquitin-protein ligase TRIM45-like n=1 Tax=Mytilus edulis TaxID=6550 RepID=UPI0039EE3751
MATSLNVGEEAEHIKGDFVDLLTCSICFEIFKQPKYLPCLHTFCETCISSYIVSKAKGNNLKGFKCPVCRRFIPMGDNLKNPETWARSLPGNYFVVSMMDRKAMKKTEKLCDTCSGKNVSKEAISWCTVCEEAYCDTCEDYHRSYKMARNHKIVPIKDMHEETPISNSCASVTCDEHPEKTIEIYCKDHTQPCCTICATVHHRKCEQVVAIDKAVSGVKESKKAQELMNKLNETGKKLDGVIKKRNHYTTNFKKEITAVLMEVANMRQKINEKLNKIENKIKDEINGARKENLLRLSEDSTELLTLKSKFDHWKNIFETCLSEGSELQCFVKLEEISRKIPKFEKDLSTVIQGIRDISVKFEATEIVSDTVRFGNLHYNEKRPSFLGLKTVNVHTEKIKVLFTIDIRGSFISGIFFNDDIIITDHDKKRVVNHEKNGKQTDKLNISKPPTDITKVNDCTVAVSSNTEKIFIINVKPLTLVKTLDSSVPLWGLCLVDNQYITARNGTISWLNSETGAKIKQIQTTSSDTRFVTSYQKGEYIYCKGGHTINFQSDVGKGFQYNHSNLSNPYNQEIDKEGKIYVVGYGSHNIHQLTPAGQLIQIIPVSDIDNTITGYPWVMRFKQNTNRFILTFNSWKVPVYVCEIE